MTDRVRMVDLAWRHGEDADRIEARVLEVLRSGAWLGGPVVEAAENAVAELFGRRGAVGVASGTDALVLGLQALGVQAGDRVGVPALTFFATAGAVCAVGAVPVVLDVDERGLLTQVPDGLRAVIPVHLFGNRATVDTAIPVLDDAAQAAGFGAGEGRLTAVSTYPTKVLSGAGNGGFVLGDDPELLTRVRRLGSHGVVGPHEHVETAGHVGRNSRLGAVEAAVLVEQLVSLPRRVARRRAIAARYDAVLGERALPRDPSNPVPVYCLRDANRNALRARLHDAGIDATVYYPHPLHRQEALRSRIEPTDAPMADRLCAELLAIPVHAGLGAGEVDRVVAVLEAG